ncbi:hypothetical protein OKW50_005488 [Paraburkholderia youngii]
MKSEEDLPLSHGVEAPALNWLTGFVAVDKAVSESADRHLKSSLGISSAQAKVIICLAGRQFMTQVQLARRLNYDMGVAIPTHSASHRRWNCNEVPASRRLSLLVRSAYGKRSGHGREDHRVSRGN